MGKTSTIKINFRGGIVSPGDLYNILVAATTARIVDVSFGLRQQLLIPVTRENTDLFTTELEKLGVHYEVDKDEYPGIISSYPAEEVFITNTWLSEGVYKDIFDGIDYTPRLKMNISDSNQSFTPMLTGNINWVASANAQHFWHLFIRFPKTNAVYEWSEMVYTNDLPRLSKDIERLILEEKNAFYDNENANGELLFNQLELEKYITKPAEKPAELPAFNLPYYEGLNRYNDKYWLGVYRRDELLSVAFLKEVCLLCLETKIGQLCSTPWKSIIIKSIEEKDKPAWSNLLEKYQLNMRHAANELNFQVEDNCIEGLKLKNYLVKRLNNKDIRTFGICIGIKTRKKSEVFSSILVKRKPLLRILGIELLHVYDILCAHDFNPNKRTGFVFSSNNPKFVLVEQLRRSLVAFHHNRSDKKMISEKKLAVPRMEKEKNKEKEYVYQCRHCFSIYDPLMGEPHNGIVAGTPFDMLHNDYTCSVCESGKHDFTEKEKTGLGLKSV